METGVEVLNQDCLNQGQLRLRTSIFTSMRPQSR
jgi:hypothetical protein